MSMRCEDVRPLLAELVYEEADPALAEQLREHLGTCLSCRRHQMAFLAVREDLAAWQHEETAPTGITFIAPGAHAATPIWRSRAFQALALAASFMFGAFLMAAAVNLQVRSGPEGWAMSTSFSDQTLDFAARPEKAEPLPVDQIHKLDTWFEARLSEGLTTRGVAFESELPSHEYLTAAQMDAVSQRAAEITAELLTRSMAEINTAHETFLRDLVAASLDMHSEEVGLVLMDVVAALEEQRDDANLSLLTDIYDTQRKVVEINGRIDDLYSLVTQVATPAERRNPEN